MSLNFPIGISDFKKIIQKGHYFVDKSLFIQAIVDDPAEVILFPRPRRFGKTLTLSMLYYFLDGFLETDHQALFDNTRIKQNHLFCEQHQNQYPVIFISLKEMKKNSFQDASFLFKTLISTLYEQYHHFLFDSLSQNNKAIYQRLLTQNGDIGDLQFSLFYLSKWLFEKTGKKSFILIDEYDAPLTQSYIKGYYDDMLDLLRGVLSASLKENQYLAKGILTGITRIAKESIFSDLNNFVTLGIFQKRFSDLFGFTEAEIQQLLKDDNHLAQLPKIKNWYNGYQFGQTVIYNPWSIINCLYHDYEFNEYWVNSSSNALIKDLLSNAKPSVKSVLTQLLQGQIIQQSVDETLVFDELKMSEQALWNLMLSSGYVTVHGHQLFKGARICQLSIPNLEVIGLYEKIVRLWFSGSEKALGNQSYDTFIQSLVDGNIEQFNLALNTYLQQSSSYFDFNLHSHEQVFHTFVLGLVVGLRDQYHIQSNKESGLGRFDVLLEPKNTNDTGFILEFKITKDPNTLQDTALQALEQIKSKQYCSTLKQRQIPGALLLGVAFCGQHALIESENITLS